MKRITRTVGSALDPRPRPELETTANSTYLPRSRPSTPTMLALRPLSGARCARSAYHRRALSSRASAILTSLNIPTSGEIPGVYDGAWGGSGEPLVSKCPSTGETLAKVSTVREIYLGQLNSG